MTIEDKIKVMQHFADGGEVEFTISGRGVWGRATSPTWNWTANDYRIKPEPQKPEDRIEAEYPEFDVIPLEWSGNKLKFEASINRHFEAQSMKGFAGYVYEDADADKGFMVCLHPTIYTEDDVTTPIAVLFTKDSKEEA